MITRQPIPKNGITRRVTLCLAALIMACTSAIPAQPTTPVDTAVPSTSWRHEYRLGPGDILSVSLFGRPNLDRNEIFIQPDGTFSYLQAQNISAAGLTVAELRVSLEEHLAKYYKRPRVILTPFELRSKKFFILGKVVDKGVFTMTRPITLLEAVARARGIETGLFEQNTVELADMARSFIVRDGQRLSVDFEALFFRGDMSQNIEIEPNDYIYFPSANTNEIYILGEIVQPGKQGFTSDMTVLGAIARREGYTESAYRERVLVVRGSLTQPETFVVNTNDILKGNTAAFRLEPKDIIYVSARPWKFAEDLLDSAIGAFIQSAVSNWTGANIGPFISEPALPQLNDDDEEIVEEEPEPEPEPEPVTTPPTTTATPGMVP